MTGALVSVCGMILVLNTAVAADPCSARRSARVELKKLKARPELFDQKRIFVSGMLKSGHLGVSLQDSEGLSIRVRAPEQHKGQDTTRACQDSLYNRFWSLSEAPRSGQEEVSYEIELEGIVRTLKGKDGKPAKDFSVFGQWPAELVSVRLFSIREIHNQSPKKDP
jgi:hypothetical protein